MAASGWRELKRSNENVAGREARWDESDRRVISKMGGRRRRLGATGPETGSGSGVGSSGGFAFGTCSFVFLLKMLYSWCSIFRAYLVRLHVTLTSGYSGLIFSFI